MDLPLVLIAASLIVTVIVMAYFLLNLYHKCGANQALIITGAVPGGIQIIVGGGAIVWPLITQMHSLSLEVMTVPLTPEKPIFTAKGEALYVSATAHVKVTAEDQAIARAAERFLNKSAGEIEKVAHDVLAGHLRATVATMTAEEVRLCRDTLALRVQEISTADLAKAGLQVEFFALEEIRDEARS
jgi:flotillin